jgi:tellurite methyltransferase
MKKIREQYNQIYSEEKKAYNEGEPSPIVQEVLKYKKEGTAIDLGAGQGRNAIFLAKNGFKVKAIDISPVGIVSIAQAAKEMELPIETEVADITEVSLSGPVDLIVSTVVLHNLSEAQGLALIQKMKEATSQDGLNVIVAITKDGDFHKLKDPGFYLDPGQLKELYKDWEILEYWERNTQMLYKNSDGSPTFNVVANLIARKPNYT